MKKVDIVKVAQWLFATLAISTSTCFTVIRFAYSDFETQRTSDVNRQAVDQRLGDIERQLIELNRKVDKILFYRR